VDGRFVRFCQRALENPARDYVFIIDEINRGNLGQILSDLLTLIEADKRGACHAIPLAYARDAGETFHVPENVHVLGTMNLADRSLAMIDYAPPHRGLHPGAAIREAPLPRVAGGAGNGCSACRLIIWQMAAVNRMIAEDRPLGSSYQIGHSFFVPDGVNFSELDRAWYNAVVKTEIAPLLEEYWHDDPQKAAEAIRQLLA